MKKILYFDFDGTLHNTAFIYRNAVQTAYEYLQRQTLLPERVISIEEASRWLGLSPPDMWEDFLPHLDEKLKMEASKMVGDKMIDQLEAGEGKLYDGVPELLKELTSRGYSLKVLSNCKESYKDTIMKVFELDKFIDDFIAAETYQYKPKHHILTQLKGKDKIVAFIGDRKSDIDAGLYHQIPSIACDYGFGTLEELSGADIHIGNILELLDLFE